MLSNTSGIHISILRLILFSQKYIYNLYESLSFIAIHSFPVQGISYDGADLSFALNTLPMFSQENLCWKSKAPLTNTEHLHTENLNPKTITLYQNLALLLSNYTNQQKQEV